MRRRREGVAAPGLAAGIPGMSVCLVGMVAVFHLPPEALYWDRGARGERRTASALEPLLQGGFVLLYGRLMPDGRGDIDAIAIGPTGVWVVETKNLSGDVSIINGRLFVKDQPRQAVVEQVYREAFAVQQIVGEWLAPLHTIATPVLCIHGARLPWFDHSVGGVRVVSGGKVQQLISQGPSLLDQETSPEGRPGCVTDAARAVVLGGRAVAAEECSAALERIDLTGYR
ncbi:MAG: nuclease-related domain-containing protein [Candidatus Limnocylindrales bacterium]